MITDENWQLIHCPAVPGSCILSFLNFFQSPFLPESVGIVHYELPRRNMDFERRLLAQRSKLAPPMALISSWTRTTHIFLTVERSRPNVAFLARFQLQLVGGRTDKMNQGLKVLYRQAWLRVKGIFAGDGVGVAQSGAETAVSRDVECWRVRQDTGRMSVQVR